MLKDTFEFKETQYVRGYKRALAKLLLLAWLANFVSVSRNEEIIYHRHCVALKSGKADTETRVPRVERTRNFTARR